MQVTSRGRETALSKLASLLRKTWHTTVYSVFLSLFQVQQRGRGFHGKYSKQYMYLFVNLLHPLLDKIFSINMHIFFHA